MTMAAQRMLHIFGTILLLLILMRQISEAAPPYPPEIQQRIDGAAKINCEIQTPRKVGIIAYMRLNEKWLVRIYTKDEQEMKILFNESASPFSLMFGITDKIYFYKNGRWLDQDTLPEEEAIRLDLRLKFGSEEKQILEACLFAVMEAMKQEQ